MGVSVINKSIKKQRKESASQFGESFVKKDSTNSLEDGSSQSQVLDRNLELATNTSKVELQDQSISTRNTECICSEMCQPPILLCMKCANCRQSDCPKDENNCKSVKLKGSQLSYCRCKKRDGLQDNCEDLKSGNDGKDGDCKTNTDSCGCHRDFGTLPPLQPPCNCYNNAIPPICCQGNCILPKMDCNNTHHNCSGAPNECREKPRMSPCNSPENQTLGQQVQYSDGCPTACQPVSPCKATCVPCHRERSAPVTIGQVVPLAPAPPYPLHSPPPLIYVQDATCECPVEMYGDPICCCQRCCY